MNKVCECVTLSKNGHLSSDDFKLIWENFIQVLIKPVSAFVIVDVQNDFISGSLALSSCPAKEDGAEVVPVINKLLDDVVFDYVFYT